MGVSRESRSKLRHPCRALHGGHAVLIGLAIYVLVLVITFLRLRIAELKRAAPPKGDSRLP